MKLTEDQKKEKLRRDSITRLINRVKSEFSFKKWKTFHGYLNSIGKPITGEDRILTFDELKGLLNEYENEALGKSSVDTKEQQVSKAVQAGQDQSSVASQLPTIPSGDKKSGAEKNLTIESPSYNASNNYGLSKSDKEKCTLFWFQKKAAAQILDGLLRKKLPAQYLIAQAGSGKTYVFGAVIRRLVDMKWHKKDTMSPWPIVVVTKASVVTQTRRVLELDFQLDTLLGEVTVIGIDQLRAKFGQMFVKETMQIVGGEEVYSYAWTPMIHPKLIILDESHSVKNQGSGQHKIMLSYSDLPNVYQLYSSATPATKVAELKAFTCACKLEYDLF